MKDVDLNMDMDLESEPDGDDEYLWSYHHCGPA